MPVFVVNAGSATRSTQTPVRPLVQPATGVSFTTSQSRKNNRVNLIATAIGGTSAGKRFIVGHFGKDGSLVLHPRNNIPGFPTDRSGFWNVTRK